MIPIRIKVLQCSVQFVLLAVFQAALFVLSLRCKWCLHPSPPCTPVPCAVHSTVFSCGVHPGDCCPTNTTKRGGVMHFCGTLKIVCYGLSFSEIRYLHLQEWSPKGVTTHPKAQRHISEDFNPVRESLMWCDCVTFEGGCCWDLWALFESSLRRMNAAFRILCAELLYF